MSTTDEGGSQMTYSVGGPADDPVGWKLEGWEKVAPGEHHRIEAAARLQQLAGDLVAALDQAAASEGLANQGDYQVLSVLRLADHRGESMTATDVARHLRMTTATMVNRVDRLERLGYVERNPHHIDRRASILAITPGGVACAERMVQRRNEERERKLSVLTDDERAALTMILRKLTAGG